MSDRNDELVNQSKSFAGIEENIDIVKSQISKLESKLSILQNEKRKGEKAIFQFVGSNIRRKVVKISPSQTLTIVYVDRDSWDISIDDVIFES